MRVFLSIFVLLLSTSSMASRSFKEMAWKEAGTFEFRQGETIAASMSGQSGAYLRIFVPEACGYASYSVSAKGKPIDPGMVYASGENYSNPDGSTYFFYVREGRDIEFETIWFERVKLTASTVCPVTLSLAPGPKACGTGPEVFAEGHSTSNVSAHIAQELAWNRTIGNAQSLCHSPKICKVPGKSSCSGTGSSGNHWRYECHGWFVCEGESIQP